MGDSVGSRYLIPLCAEFLVSGGRGETRVRLGRVMVTEIFGVGLPGGSRIWAKGDNQEPVAPGQRGWSQFLFRCSSHRLGCGRFSPSAMVSP